MQIYILVFYACCTKTSVQILEINNLLITNSPFDVFIRLCIFFKLAFCCKLLMNCIMQIDTGLYRLSYVNINISL